MPIGNPLRSEGSAFTLVVVVAVLMGCVIAAALLGGRAFGVGVAAGIVVGIVTWVLVQRSTAGGPDE